MRRRPARHRVVQEPTTHSPRKTDPLECDQLSGIGVEVDRADPRRNRIEPAAGAGGCSDTECDHRRQRDRPATEDDRRRCCVVDPPVEHVGDR